MARLVCEKGPVEGQTFEIGKGVTIGRGPHNDIGMPTSKKSSRDHAKLWEVGKGQYAVADLGSTNGTLVNDGKVSRHNLRDGDMVQVGEAIFRFELGEDEKPKPVVREKSTERESLADMLGGKKKKDSIDSGAPMPKIEFKQRILQYQKKEDKPAGLGIDVSQTAGPMRWVLTAVAIGVFVVLFMVMKNVIMGAREANAPGDVEEEEDE